MTPRRVGAGAAAPWRPRRRGRARLSCSTRASSGLAAAQKIIRQKRSVLFTKVSYATSSTAMELTRSKLHHCSMYCSDRVVTGQVVRSGSGRVVRPLRVVRTRVVRPRG